MPGKTGSLIPRDAGIEEESPAGRLPEELISGAGI
jgi:hypothetical protein